MKKNVIVFGSTGSIGCSTLDVIAAHSERFRVRALAAGRNIKKLAAQIRQFSPAAVAVELEKDADLLQREFADISVFSGPDGLMKLIHDAGHSDMLVSAITGTVPLRANLEALRRGMRVCLANKETMVAAGDLVNRILESCHGELLPVDSEHSAIFQCIGNHPQKEIKKIVLTASGGPFRNTPLRNFADITVEMALNHPTWNMGRKITIDSATMMNKALEVIEALYLFKLNPHQIEVLVHPQSIVHSMVEFVDTAVLAQLGMPDMRTPIQYALTWPERIEFSGAKLDLARTGILEFFEPCKSRFPALKLADHVMKNKKNSGAVMNAANEVAVEAFLERKIKFTDIFIVVSETLDKINLYDVNDPGDVFQAIDQAKAAARDCVKNMAGRKM